MFAKNLKYYRLKMHMSKKELAFKVGVTPMAITHYEKGSRKPEMDIIKKMANALEIKVSDFISIRNKNLIFKHAQFRKNTNVSETQIEYIKETIEEYFSRFFTIVDCYGGNPLPNPPKCHTLKSTNDIEQDAKLLKKYLGFNEEGPIRLLISVLENKGIMVLELEDMPDSFSGINGTVNEYPYIAINHNMTMERKRSTIVHELAHMMFDSLAMEEEKYATALSGAFLISKEDLLRELGFKRHSITNDMLLICKEYGISMWLLVMRASHYQIISSSLSQSFYINASKKGWRKNEPSRIFKEEPTLFKQLVYRAINEEDINIQKGAELLRSSYEEVKEACQLMFF